MSEISKRPYRIRTILKTDSIVDSIIDQLVERSKKGLETYNTDMDRTDLEVSDWIKHMKEELLDGVIYLEKLEKLLTNKDK